MTFDTLGLDPKLLKAIANSGYTKPTKVQLKTIPKVLKGLDIRASAQTGTGKTAAFLLPALNRLISPSTKTGKGPRVLIIVPTRELAMQITTQAEKYSKYLSHLKTVCISGGVPYHAQLRKLSRPCDILIATPGRLIDLIDKRKVSFSRLEMLVLDEADRMLDMGFLEPVEEIVSKTPPSRQTLLFSATLHGSVIKLSERLLNKPIDIIIHAEREKNENIKQNLHYVDDLHHKNRLLDHILNKDGVDYAIIFTSTKRHANKLFRELNDKGHRTAALHGDMNQRQRTRTIMQFKNGRIRILVATDVAARGIDVLSITHVINFDLPRNVEDYVHRIGRTGRAGAKGTALSFAAGKDAFLVKKIEKFTGQQIDIVKIAGLEPREKKSFSKKSFSKKSFSKRSPSKSTRSSRSNYSTSRRFKSKDNTSQKRSRSEEKTSQEWKRTENRPAKRRARSEEKPSQEWKRTENRPAKRRARSEEKPSQEWKRTENRPAKRRARSEEKPSQEWKRTENRPAKRRARSEEKPSQEWKRTENRPAKRRARSEEKPSQEWKRTENRPAKRRARSEDKSSQKQRRCYKTR